MVINVHTFHHTVMVHCRERGDEMIVGDLSHLHIYEQGGSAHVSVPPPVDRALCTSVLVCSVCLCPHSWLVSTPPQ